jgi:hypothetical protein
MISFRPLPRWPYPETNPRKYGQFRHRGTRISIERSLRDLEAEVEKLTDAAWGTTSILIGVGYELHEVRKDGQPRADARAPRHPGVEVTFDSRYGRLSYATDVFEDWRDNVRAIALGLEALRAVDRWGVSKRGQQYAGFLQLETNAPNASRGKELVDEAGGLKAALLRHHPDQGGDPRRFADVQAYRQLVRS